MRAEEQRLRPEEVQPVRTNKQNKEHHEEPDVWKPVGRLHLKVRPGQHSKSSVTFERPAFKHTISIWIHKVIRRQCNHRVL